MSAFAPIANPINCPWGQKAFKGYFGEDQQEKWKEHDATELVKKYKGPLDLLIDIVCAACGLQLENSTLTTLIGNVRQLLPARSITTRELCRGSKTGRQR